MYEQQVALLSEIIQEVVDYPTVALKGGSAINLYIENMPRLSVDIDLCYLPVENRETSFSKIHAFMNEKAENLSRRARIITKVNQTHEGIAKQIHVTRDGVTVKIEINHVLRGHLYDIENRELCEKAQEEFKSYSEIPCLSFEEVYAGKFCAALDRQHPRDLYDIKKFFEKHTISERLKYAFLIYLISGNRPIAELIKPNLLDKEDIFKTEFEGMTDSPVSYKELKSARTTLIKELDRALTTEDRKFLLSFKEKSPNWTHIPIEGVDKLPAIKWKLLNIEKMSPEKHRDSISYLKYKLEV